MSDAKFTAWINRCIEAKIKGEIREAVYWFDLAVIFGKPERDVKRMMILQHIAGNLHGLEVDREDHN